MRSEDVQLGVLVEVHQGSREADLRDRIGIVRQIFWNPSYTPFKVQFESTKNKPLELL
jgi:hypothetical protein